MKHNEIKVMLTEEEMKKAAGRYHFLDTDLFQIQKVYEEIQSGIKPSVYYAIVYQGEDRQDIPYDIYAVCIVTLGIYPDKLQTVYTKEGRLLDSYIVDCISMELLKKAYAQTAEQIEQETGLYTAAYDFLGEKIPLEKMKDIFACLRQEEVVFNAAYMLTPGKSVVYIAELTKEKKKSCICLCENCMNQTCKNRMDG